MAKRWTYAEEELLVENYSEKTIKELMELFPGKSQESVNNKIKRLKKAGKLSNRKSQAAKDRAYKQRRD